MPAHLFQFNFQMLDHWKDLPTEEVTLIEEAFRAMEKAYAPYSRFKVGATARLENGILVSGSNQENIAFPSGLCAERVALNYAGANYPGIAIDTLAVVAQGELMPESQLLSPCGGCRQVMLESENRQNTPIKVILVNQDQRTMIIEKVKDLLPFGFGK
ncbi:MAG: cytidine deaminase [Flavobacteriia bacterium]|nr:cytidine deaminase [Flavobacteriia bacterium]